MVSAGQPVITLALAKEIEVSAAVPEDQIASLKAGDPAFISLWSAPNVNSEGKIREIAGAADVASRTYAVRVTIGKPVAEMRLGMTTSVAFKIPEPGAPIVAPLTAFTEENGKTIVYVANRESQTVSRREVLLDGVTEDGVRVKAGLAPGEVVVTGGVQFLKDGMRVRLTKDFMTAVAVADGGGAVRPTVEIHR